MLVQHPGRLGAAPGLPPNQPPNSRLRVRFPESPGVNGLYLDWSSFPPCASADLANVCFAGPACPSPDRLAARDALLELSGACPGRRWRLLEVDAELADVERHRWAQKGSGQESGRGGALWNGARQEVGCERVQVD